jgi:hypothetical protein
MELARMKYLAEQRLIQSSVFGRANNPVNFISAHDVARFVELAAMGPGVAAKSVAT